MRRVLIGVALLGALLVAGSPGATAQATAPALTATISAGGGNASWNQTAAAVVTVSDGSLAPAIVSLLWDNATGVDVSASPTQVPVAQGAPASITVSFGVTNATPLGDQLITLRAADATTNATSNDVSFLLHVVRPNGTADASTTNTPTNATQGATNTTAPPANGTADPAGPGPATNATAEPGGVPSSDGAAQRDPAPAAQPDAQASDAPAQETLPSSGSTSPVDPAPPTAPPPPASPRQIAVDPAVLVLPPEGSGRIRVVETDLVPVTLALPAGFSAKLVQSGAGVWTYEIAAQPAAVENVTLGARALAGNASAPFGLRVEPPARVEAASAPPAPGPRAPSLAPWAILAALVGAGALALSWAHRRWPLVFAALYHRIAPSRLLAHPTRERLLEAVRAEPGVSMRELQRRMGLAKGVFDYHLHRLLVAGVVRAVADGQRRRLYLPGSGTPAAIPPLADRLLALVRSRGRVSAASVAEELGVSRQALHYHVKRLCAEGRLRGRTEGRDLVLSADP